MLRLFAAAVTLLVLLLLSMLTSFVAAADNRACSLSDYAETVGPCDTTSLKRKVTYAKRGTSCVGPTTIDLGEERNCPANVCTLADFEPVVGANNAPATCSGGVMHVDRYAAPASPRCGSIGIAGSVLCPCTASDIAQAVTPCVGGTRRFTSYFASDCDSTTHLSVALPPPLVGPCDAGAACFPGEAARPLCAACGTGTYSTSRIVYDRYDGGRMPTAFVESCFVFDPVGSSCAAAGHGAVLGWRPTADGRVLTTGDARGVHNVDVSFSVHITIERLPASFGFQYRLSTEAGSDMFAVISSTAPEDALLYDSGSSGNDWRRFEHTFTSEVVPADELCQWSLQLFLDDAVPPVLTASGNNATTTTTTKPASAFVPSMPGPTTCVTVNQIYPYSTESFWSSPDDGVTPTTLTLLPIKPLNAGCVKQDDFRYHRGLVDARLQRLPPAGANEQIVFVVLANESSDSNCAFDQAPAWSAEAGAHGLLFVLAGENSATVGYPNRNRFIREPALLWPRQLKVGSISAAHHEQFLVELFENRGGYATKPQTAPSAPAPRYYGRRSSLLRYNKDPGFKVELMFVLAKDGSVDSEGPADFVEIAHLFFDIAAPQCRAASPGYFVSRPGATAQEPCPFDHYTDTPGASGCKRCAPGTGAAPGSSKCTPLRACLASDYEPFYLTSCTLNQTQQHWTRTVTYRLPPHSESLCTMHAPGAQPPPPDAVQECDLCPYGSFHQVLPGVVGANGATPTNCVSCDSSKNWVVDTLPEPGALSVGTAPAKGCRHCYKTEIPARRLQIDDFATLDPSITQLQQQNGEFLTLLPGMSCPSCTLGSIRNGATALFLGKKEGFARAELVVDFTLERPGTVWFSYLARPGEVSRADAMLNLDITVYQAGADGSKTAIEYHKGQQIAVGRGTSVFSAALPIQQHATSTITVGRKTLVVEASSEGTSPGEADFPEFAVFSLTIDGVQNAPAESCTPCPAGFSCDTGAFGASPQPCPAGTASQAGKVDCVSCAAQSDILNTQYVNANRMSSSCFACPDSLVGSNGTACLLAAHGFFPQSVMSESTADVKKLTHLLATPVAKPDAITRVVGEPIASSLLASATHAIVNLNLLFRDQGGARRGVAYFNRSRSRDVEISLTLSDPTDPRVTRCLSARDRETTSISYGCARNMAGKEFSIGNRILVAEQRAALSGSGLPGVHISVTGAPCDDNAIAHPDTSNTYVAPRTYIFEIACDPYYDAEPHIELDEAGVNDRCRTVVRARHASACPLCEAQLHMAYTDLKCGGERSRRVRSFTYADAAGNALDKPPCRPGTRLPDSVEEACSLFDVHVTQLGLSVGAIVVIVLGSVFLLVSLYLYKKFRRTHQGYAKLRAEFAARGQRVATTDDGDGGGSGAIGARAAAYAHDGDDDDDNTAATTAAVDDRDDRPLHDNRKSAAAAVVVDHAYDDAHVAHEPQRGRAPSAAVEMTELSSGSKGEGGAAPAANGDAGVLFE